MKKRELLSCLVFFSWSFFSFSSSVKIGNQFKVIENFSCSLTENSEVEFRYFDGERFGIDGVFSMLTAKQGKLWYASFGNLGNRIKQLKASGRVQKDLRFFGKFRHKSFSGKSFLFNMDETVKSSLEETIKKQKLFSIWDFVSCKEAKFDLLYLPYIGYKLKLKEVSSCAVQWD